MKKTKILGSVFFGIAVLAIIAMFITASAIKGSSWTAIDWITKHFWYGYYWFIFGAIFFTVAGISLILPNKNIFVKLWNNNNLLICISLCLVVLFGFVFSRSMLLYIIAMGISLAGGVFVAWMTGNGKWTYLGRSLLIAFAFGVILVLICTFAQGESQCPYCGGKGYFGGGKYGQMVDCPDC